MVFFGLLGCASSPPDREPGVPPPLELNLEPSETIVDRAFLRGLVALKLHDYERARAEVGRVAAACPTDPIGVRALLTLAAAELDPRNPGGDPQLARQLVERFFQIPEKPAWTEPLAETLYLVALDRGGGAPPENAAVADAAPEGNPESAARVVEDGEVYVPAREARATFEAAPDRDDPRLFLASPEFRPTPAECAEASGELRGGALEAPILSRPPLADQMTELVQARDSLQVDVDALERELAELRQELERIRETLRP